jgi:DNA-binding CsgD family transcriptional regulator
MWHNGPVSWEALSDREQQVASQLATGLRVSGIARELCIAEVTVRNHLRTIFSKLDVHSQSQLVELVRRHPMILGAHRRVEGLSEPSLADELAEVDRQTIKRIDAVFADHDGFEAMKAVFRAVLPLDEERRREWRTRLAVHAVADQQREVREVFGEVYQRWRSRPLDRILGFQDAGWLRADLDPDETRRRLVGVVHGAALALLADPSPEEKRRQLAEVDAVLESLVAEDRR